jgi:DNA repair protein RecN (Recombination protein N)
MAEASATRCYLADLTIVDFAVIDRVQLALAPGFVVITGETGAGKSIVVDALGAALGSRASTDWIRAGSERAWVEAIFAFPETVPGLDQVLGEAECPPEPGSLFLRRDVVAGRSVARVNSRAVAGRVLDDVANRLVDVHSQGDHVAILNPRAQLDTLDRFGHLGDLRSQVGEAVRALVAVRKEIQDISEDRREALREEELLRHEVEEIDAVAPQSDEDETLTATRTRLKNALRLRTLAEQVQTALGGAGGEPGALDLIGEAHEALAQLGALDPAAPVNTNDLIAPIDAVETLLGSLRKYSSVLEDDQTGLEEVEERLLSLADLKRRFGPTLTDVIAYADESRARLSLLADVDERLAHLAGKVTALEAEAAQKAQKLSAARSDAAERLGAAIESQLHQLGMRGASFTVTVRQRSAHDGLAIPGVDEARAFDETGVDQVEFLIAANPGDPGRPLGRVASGGELSRVMLGVKTAAAAADPVPVLVFDELDQGVGGRMGHVIGEKLWQLSREHQVICITHLPQVACYADSHYVVKKELVDGSTATSVVGVEAAAREEELAVMLGGPVSGGAALGSAKELLTAAADWKRAQS